MKSAFKMLGVIACILTGLFSGPTVNAQDAGGVLPISVTLISCGPTVEKACKRDDRCCTLLDGFELAEAETQAEQSIPDPLIEELEGFIDVQNLETEMDVSQQSATVLLQ